jgi:hypothetical protein
LPDEQWRSLWQKLRAQFEADTAARLVVEALYIAAVTYNMLLLIILKSSSNSVC